MQREKITHKAIIAFFKIASPVPVKIIKIDNEGRKGQTAGLESEGFTPGAADTIILFPACYQPSTVWAEVKTKKLTATKKGAVRVITTKQQPNQEQFQADIEGMGHAYWLLPDVDTAKKYLNEWCAANNLQSRVIE